MLENLSNVPGRIAALKRKLAAREGKSEYVKNVEAIRAEITRLEAVSLASWDKSAAKPSFGERCGDA